jgi:hypothetical protein
MQIDTWNRDNDDSQVGFTPGESSGMIPVSSAGYNMVSLSVHVVMDYTRNGVCRMLSMKGIPRDLLVLATFKMQRNASWVQGN